jgi:hypothetical protein
MRAFVPHDAGLAFGEGVEVEPDSFEALQSLCPSEIIGAARALVPAAAALIVGDALK